MIWRRSKRRRSSSRRFSLPVAELRIRPVFLAIDILHHGLAAAHGLGLLVVGVGRRAEQVPALVQRRRHLMAEAGVVRGGEKAVEFHRPIPVVYPKSANIMRRWRPLSPEVFRPAPSATARPSCHSAR